MVPAKGGYAFFLSYQTRCRSIGVEYDERIYQEAAAVWTCTTVKVHTWTGMEHRTGIGDGSESESGKMVYMTENGQVYHKKMSCSYLDLSITQVAGSSVSSRRNAYGEKYYPCESCSKGKKAAGRVYITEKGNRYHNLETCSGLKRAVRLVKESEIKGIHACSRCG